MATLEKVMEMKNQGIQEGEITNSLQEQGISPKEITDALTQSKIKQAVASEIPTNEGMEPSMMGTSLSETTPPQNQEEEIYQPQMPSQQYTQENSEAYPNQQSQEYYPQEGYGNNSYSETNVDNIIEISEQVFSEKIKKIQEQLRDLNEIKSLLSTKVENIESRLKRMERFFDQMQVSIIEKVGTYGKSLNSLKKELEMVEDSFSKIHKTHKKTPSKN